MEQERERVFTDIMMQLSFILCSLLLLKHYMTANVIAIYSGSAALTKYLILGDVESCNTERRVLVVFVSVDDQLPVMDASREADVTDDDSVVEARRRNGVVVVCKQHITCCSRRVEAEPRHCRQQFNSTRCSLTLHYNRSQTAAKIE